MRVEALTFLRFVAAAIVVIFHFGRKIDVIAQLPVVFRSGPEMVTFFFVLSGFVLTVAHDGKDISLSSFYIKRFARIFPLYLVALLLMLSLVRFGTTNHLLSVALSFSLLQSWFPPYPMAINPPAWSLSVEAFFYLSFPFIASAFRSPARSIVAALGIWALTQAVLADLLNSPFYLGFPSYSHDIIFYFPLSHLCSFLLGCAGGLWFAKTRSVPPQSIGKPGKTAREVGSLLLLGSCFTLIALMLQYSHRWVAVLGFDVARGSSFYAPFFLALILVLSHSDNMLVRLISSAPFRLLGDASYGMYILQKPVEIIFTRYLGQFVHGGPLQHFLWLCVVLIGLSVPLYYFVERPLAARAGSFIRHRRATTVATGLCARTQ